MTASPMGISKLAENSSGCVKVSCSYALDSLQAAEDNSSDRKVNRWMDDFVLIYALTDETQTLKAGSTQNFKLKLWLWFTDLLHQF